jgi:hypothetical protein
MDTLVLAERCARPGQAASLLAAMQRLEADRALHGGAMRPVRIFVDVAAPTHILWATQWTTRAACEAAVPGDLAVQALDSRWRKSRKRPRFSLPYTVGPRWRRWRRSAGRATGRPGMSCSRLFS